MLSFLFGFNARLGRLHYFLGTIALAVVMTVAFFAIAMSAIHATPRGTPLSIGQIAWPAAAALLFFLAATFTLQSMRIRDIGWDPVCVIPAWIALLIVDKVIATKFPAWSLGQDHAGTVVGGLVNLALVLALTFWPSGDHESPTPGYGETRRRPEPPSPRQQASSVAAERLARVTGESGRRAY
jgi:uncharacterized membrane protein YhaH (DUF805 family)